MAKMNYDKARMQQKIYNQGSEDWAHGQKPVSRKRKCWRPHKLSKLNKATVNALYSKLVNKNGVKEDTAFGIVRDEMFRLIHKERERASNVKSSKRNRRKR